MYDWFCYWWTLYFLSKLSLLLMGSVLDRALQVTDIAPLNQRNLKWEEHPHTFGPVLHVQCRYISDQSHPCPRPFQYLALIVNTLPESKHLVHLVRQMFATFWRKEKDQEVIDSVSVARCTVVSTCCTIEASVSSAVMLYKIYVSKYSINVLRKQWLLISRE